MPKAKRTITMCSADFPGKPHRAPHVHMAHGMTTEAEPSEVRDILPSDNAASTLFLPCTEILLQVWVYWGNMKWNKPSSRWWQFGTSGLDKGSPCNCQLLRQEPHWVLRKENKIHVINNKSSKKWFTMLQMWIRMSVECMVKLCGKRCLLCIYVKHAQEIRDSS